MLNSLHYFKYLAGLAPALTQTSAAEQKCLREHAVGKKRLAEIGVYHGANTRIFRELMAKDGVIIAIDPFPRRFFGIRGYGWARRVAHREVARSQNGRVLWVETFGKDAPQNPLVAGLLPVDFIFIDGDHSWEGLKGDWESWSGQIALGGIVALHDSCHCEAGSERFTQEVILKDERFVKINAVDTLTVLQRKSV
jgi:hypothetical protein